MENYGLIIRHLRALAGLSVRDTAQKIGRSIGWLSEIENNSGTARLTDTEFNRIVEALEGSRHRPMFRTWVAAYKNRARVEKTFDGAVLKFIRLKKGITLREARKLTGLSTSYLSKIETGVKPVPLEMRNRIMEAYGYSPSSFKNLGTDPIRSKVVPTGFKLQILLQGLSDIQTEAVFQFALALTSGNQNADTKIQTA
jgi:transcriptional regulator with XRE-family HTH domain